MSDKRRKFTKPAIKMEASPRVASTGHFILMDADGNKSDPIPYDADWKTINEACKDVDIAVIDNWGAAK